MRTVPKPWGSELIFAENDRYAGKILRLEGGQALSLQYHEKKDETIYVLEGELDLEVDEGGTMLTRRLQAGEAYRIRPLVRHRMRADRPCRILEVSSPELDDVVRLEDAYGRAGTKDP
ncbi:MAG TPA: cupin domain-containing protein [Thermoanaerobaculia bacterium]|nr:cupin domain-containing protein [Thermoanaerobaculia bacterium]